MRAVRPMKNSIYFLIFLLLTSLPAQAADLLAIEGDGAQETITLSVPRHTPGKVFILPRPDRLVVDVPSVPGRPHVALPSDYQGGTIKAVRFGQFDPSTSRFVFDLTMPVRVKHVEKAEGKIAITMTASGKKPEKPAAAEEEKPPALDEDAPRGQREAEQKRKEEERQARMDKMPDKPVIIIDPGHGGVDPGTIGASGVEEKDIVLRYARDLKAKLLKSGKYYVKLTRSDDSFIMLRKRVTLARKGQGAIFISLHADSAPKKSARGLSVYTLSERASDEETEALAARENKADVLAGIDLSEERDDVAGILISLAERETNNRSITLADILVAKLEDNVELLPNTHRFAGFAVLKAPDIPSVLIELGFLSHPAEEKLIRSKEYRDKVTSGIASGIDAYFRQQKRMESQ